MVIKDINVLYFVSICVFMYFILAHLNAGFQFLVILFLLSPAFAFWLEYTLLKYGKRDRKRATKEQKNTGKMMNTSI